MALSANTEDLAGKTALIQEVSKIITERTGVQLGEKQVSMVESRLTRRLYELGLTHFNDYRAYFEQHRTDELEALVSLLTTHHTFFFREFVQFEFLEKNLPLLVERARARGSKILEIYSAACSRGQEVYSLAMHLDRHLKIIAPDFNFKIFGSDVDSASIKIASNGVYRRDELKTVPIFYMGNHWARGTGEISEFVKAKKTIAEKCSFAVINLLDPKELTDRKFDAIFCRNVFIYFTPAQVEKISLKLASHLYPEGLFFVGVSETLNFPKFSLSAVGPSVYGIPAPKSSVAQVKPVVAPAAAAKVVEDILPNPLRVLCVDDSSSILTLLKKILTKEHGFEVIGTAVNGQEAMDQVLKLKPDVLTLDIHMPVKTGIEFLEGSKKKDTPPVVMVTSVSREDAALAWKALSLGAADYVEKPALNNIELRADEIRMKLKSSYRARFAKVSRALDKQFAKNVSIASPEKTTCLCVFSLGDLEKCISTVKELIPSGCRIVLAVEGADAILPALAERIQSETKQNFVVGTEPTVKDLFVVSNLKNAARISAAPNGPVSVMVWGEISKHGAQDIVSLSGAQLLLEDIGSGKGASNLEELATDILPATSFSYLAQDFLASKQKGVK